MWHLVTIPSNFPLGTIETSPYYQWCRDTFGPPFQKINGELTYTWKMNDNWFSVTASFRDPNQALMFNLRWT